MIESDERVRRLLDRLEPRRVESDEWDDVLERLGDPALRVTSKPTPHLRATANRGWRRHERWRLITLVALIGLAAAVTLTVTMPWRGGPTILERAAAAIPTPTSSQVLYENIVIHPGTSSGSTRSTMHLQVWLAGTAPHPFRVVLDGPSLPNPVEVGGTIGSAEGLSYNNVYRVLDPVPFQSPIIEADLNPAAFIRAAVNSGHARPGGTSTIAGRQVIRIIVTSRLSGHSVGTTLYFVDAHTYQPVRVIVNAAVPNGSPLWFPMASLTALPYGQFPEPKKPYVLVFDFEKFQYLTPTTKNLGVTNIQAQHPTATIV